PILQRNCFECHSHDSGKAKGGLVLDSRTAILTGGDSGPALVPGDPDKSLLIQAILYKNPDLQMPPKTRLEEKQISILAAWIKNGAPAPDA
ncbi:c-type cytochrome domain-containing protein, partial [Enterococcus casseliflavus]|uniref:c-type cytochrome domain-containing protein n=1 Tax=Enterococcus casseliflavus TaxID=37734 RepID=UPI003D0F6BB7